MIPPITRRIGVNLGVVVCVVATVSRLGLPGARGRSHPKTARGRPAASLVWRWRRTRRQRQTSEAAGRPRAVFGWLRPRAPGSPRRETVATTQTTTPRFTPILRVIGGIIVVPSLLGLAFAGFDST